MIDAKKPCPGCNSRDEKGRMMHRIDNIETQVIKGYWCPKCGNWEEIEKPLSHQSGR